ncbi:MAG: thioredoxin family protein, partial [Bacteroidetes bacterium]|nr:thioredoxin family protein [Bacteroidota bacterium]
MAKIPPSGIMFLNGSWKDALKTAQKQEKIIFVEAYATWCAPCREMEQEVFSNPDVANYFNQNFVNFRANIGTIDGEEFKAKYEVAYLPDIIFLNTDGEVIFRDNGKMSTSELITLAEQLLNDQQQNKRKKNTTSSKNVANNSNAPSPVFTPSNTNYYAATHLDRMYQEGYRKADFLYKYAQQLRSNNQITAPVANDYLKKVCWNPSKRHQASTINFIYDFADEAPSKALELLIKRHKEYDDHYGGLHIETKIKNSLRVGVKRAAINRNENDFKECLRLARKAPMQNSRDFISEIKCTYYLEIKDWNEYADEINGYAYRNQRPDAVFLNNAAVNILYNTSDGKLLKRATNWAERSIKVESRYYNNLTYARLLLKQNNLRKAHEIASLAIHLAQKQGE